MFKYNNGELTIMKVDVPKIPMNVMQDQQDSYRKYVTSTVYTDMKYLEELLQGVTGLEKLSLKVSVGELVSHTFARTQVNKGKFYYPVIGTFSIDGSEVGRDVELLRVPYMDDYCKVNINGSSKVVLCTQKPSEDISYTLKDNMFNIAMPHANIRIFSTKQSIRIAYGTSKVAADKVLVTMMHECGDERNIYDIFKNTFLLNAFTVPRGAINTYVADSVNKSHDIPKKYYTMRYELGDTRDALNEYLTINRAVGERLSRPILSYEEGSLVTESMIAEFKRNRINEVYVVASTIPDGYTYCDDLIVLTEIPAGCRNCAFLRKQLPQYAHLKVFNETVKLSEAEIITIINGMPLTKDMVEFLQMIGYKEITVSAGSSKSAIRYSFEREIIGNYTARLRELTDKIPDGRFADEWVYFFNNPNLERVDDTHLTAHDLMAIISIIGQIMVTGESPLLNRDTSFLKRVMLINDQFSETLRKTMEEYISKYRNVLYSKITSTQSDNVFFGLTKAWYSFMNKERLLAPVDTTDLASEVAQVCHVETVVQGHEAVDDMRHLAMPFYGRICPFETPEGRKLGIVNTRAIGAKVVNGLLKAPYRKVIKTSNGIRISDKITYLSVKEEMGFKFGDLLSLKKDENGNYLNTPILAKIPNPVVSDEPFIFANIMSFDLAGGYVEAYPEQFLSPTAALVPCACSDDAVRVSYGINKYRQAIYLNNSTKPLLRTHMYEDIFTFSGVTRFTSPCNGVITSINNQQAIIKEDITGNEIVVPMQNMSLAGQLDMTLDVMFKSGQRVSIGDLLAEGFKYPQSFVVRAPFDGVIRGIRDNAIEIEKSDTLSSFVNLDNVDRIAFDNGRIMGKSAVFMNVEVCVGDFVKKGQIIASTNMSRDGVYSPSRSELCAFLITAYNYEDGISISEETSVHYTSIIAHSIDKTINKKHFPHVSANPLQGFKYCGVGDVIGKITTQDDTSTTRYYEEEVKAVDKKTGIPFEHSTLEDTADRRVYRFHLLGFNKLGKGDKQAGCHGNKGATTKVFPNSQQPMLSNGLVVGVCLNPNGIPSRMNLGQLDEAPLTLCAKVLNVYLIADGYNGASPEDIQYLMDFTWELANDEAIGPVGGPYNRSAFDAVCRKYSKLPEDFKSDRWQYLDNITDWRGVFNNEGAAEIYDPITGTMLDGRAVIGYNYMSKLAQEADEKINYRSGPLDEQYSRTTSQPQKGDNSNNGQRVGEMEFMAWASYGAASMINEILNGRSDNIGERLNMHLEQLGIPYRVPAEGCTSRAVENLLYFLEAMGVKLEVPKEVADVSQEAVHKHISYNLKKLIQRHFAVSDNTTYKLKSSSMMSDFEDCADFFAAFGIK